MTMPVLYIAGPMYGLPEKNYPAFVEAEEELTAAGYGIISPLQADHFVLPSDPEPSREWWMRTTLRLMLTAEGLALLDGWDDSRGARLEFDVAQQLGMPCKPKRLWLGGDD